MKKGFIQAGALTYAIFVMLVTVIIVGTIITIAFHHKKFIEVQIARQNLISYTNSLLTASTADSTISFPYNGNDLNLTQNKNYKFEVIQSTWGGYTILTASSSYGLHSYKKKILTGNSGFLENNTAFYMTDNGNALSISGNSDLVGNCYIPKSGIKASYMEGNYYRGKQLVYGEIKESKNSLPEIDKSYINFVKSALSGNLHLSDSIIDFADIYDNEFYNSFYNKPLIITSNEPLFLNQCSFEGNIIIVSSKPVTVFPSANLIDIILFAPQIHFKKRTEVSLQAYASDTITLEYATHLKYPSILGVINDKKKGFIEIEKDCQVDGNIFIVKDGNTKENLNFCRIKQGVFINGLVYIDGKVTIQGDIFGSLLTNTLVLKTLSSYYENHLYNVEINRLALSPYYASAIWDNRKRLITIKALD